MEPETDEQIGAKPDHLPENEGEEQVIGKNESQHGEGEQGHISVITVVAGLVALHVAQRVYLPHQADDGDDDSHHYRKLVGNQSEVNADAILDNHPADIGHEDFVVCRGHYRCQRPDGYYRRGGYRQDGDIPVNFRAPVYKRPYQQAVDDKGEQRQQHDEPDILIRYHSFLNTSLITCSLSSGTRME